MIGDSLGHDVLGARAVGMHSILLARGGAPSGVEVPVITTLTELPALLHRV
jgi:FMN phosphatase YigB (HAD superfamily)